MGDVVSTEAERRVEKSFLPYRLMEHRDDVVLRHILANRNRRLYLGVTSDLERRLWERRNTVRSRFASRYNMDRPVLVEDYVEMDDALARAATEALGLRQEDRPHLATELEWRDLSADWYD